MSKSESSIPATDPHRVWLTELRATSVRITSNLDDELPGTVPGMQQRAATLQRQIAETEATTKDGVLAQAELLHDLTRNEVTHSLAQQVVSGIKTLWD